MKILVLLSLLYGVLVGEHLEQVAHSFSKLEKESLLEELHKSSFIFSSKQKYSLKQGWNKLSSPKDGINVEKTFSNVLNIAYVVTYDAVSKLWAVYAHNELFVDMLYLKYIEPRRTFFVLAKKDTQIEIKSNILRGKCSTLIDDLSYGFIIDSGISQEYTLSSDALIALQSRYFSHHEKGIYNDTRVMLLYPKLKKATKKTLKYAPGYPKISIRFDKAYEGREFYVYDYKYQKCFQGVFPSMKIPPFALLKEVH